ncbi:MAG: glycosyltransferase [Lentisphaerota bacterium]
MGAGGIVTRQDAEVAKYKSLCIHLLGVLCAFARNTFFMNTTPSLSEMISEWPTVSVVVVTRNRRSLAMKAVESILGTEYPNDKRQLVIIEETDSSEHPFNQSGIKYCRLPVRNLGVAFARNEGLRQADSNIVAFTDDDCLVDPQWLKQIVCPFVTAPPLGATAGAVLVPECGPIGQCENILGFPGGGAKYLRQSKGQTIPMATFSTCNAAINRNVSGSVQFPEGFLTAGEDSVLSRQISSKHGLLYNPKAVVRHKPRDSLPLVFNWFRGRGQARVRVVQYEKRPVRYILKTLAISQTLRLLGLVIALWLLNLPVFYPVLFLAALYYLSVLWRFRWAQEYYPSLKTFFLIPVVKTVMDVGMDAGVFTTLIKEGYARRLHL